MTENYRIATNQGALPAGWFERYGFPLPDLPTYRGHSRRGANFGGGESRRGFAQAMWFYDRLAVLTLYEMNAFLTAALDGGGLIYLTIDIGVDGVNPPNSWVDVSAVPILPQVAPVTRTRGALVDNVTFRFNNVKILANPASGL